MLSEKEPAWKKLVEKKITIWFYDFVMTSLLALLLI